MDIIVLGATGYTGRKIVRELFKQGLSFGIAGRDKSRLEALRRELHLPEDLPQIIATPTEPESLAKLCQSSTKVKVLINCVGPFTRYGEPVVKAAVEAGLNYLDITGEQQYLMRVIEKYDVLAKQRGCAVIPACGVEYALSNWAVAMSVQNREPLDEIVTATVIEQVNASRGTQLSLFETLGELGYGWQDGKWVRRHAANQIRRISFPAPFGEREAIWSPFGEQVTIPRHIQVQNMNSFFALGKAPVKILPFISPILPGIGKIMATVLHPFAKNPDHNKPEDSIFAIVAESTKGDDKRRVSLVGKNVYEMTATLVVWCVEKMLQPDFKLQGVLGPAQAFDAQIALDFLTKNSNLLYDIR